MDVEPGSGMEMERLRRLKLGDGGDGDAGIMFKRGINRNQCIQKKIEMVAHEKVRFEDVCVCVQSEEDARR